MREQLAERGDVVLRMEDRIGGDGAGVSAGVVKKGFEAAGQAGYEDLGSAGEFQATGEGFREGG